MHAHTYTQKEREIESHTHKRVLNPHITHKHKTVISKTIHNIISGLEEISNTV